MSLNIKNDEAVRLAHELAAATGETVTTAVTVAVRERLERVQRVDESVARARAVRMLEIRDDSGARWREPYLSGDHGEMLYDDRGLPR